MSQIQLSWGKREKKKADNAALTAFTGVRWL
jgi:hypothetical protein